MPSSAQPGAAPRSGEPGSGSDRGTEATPPPLARRAFLTAAGTGLLASCAGPDVGDAPAVATGRTVQWRLASTFPRGLDGIWGSAERLAAKLEALTDGRFRIRPYPAGELVPPFSVLDAAQQGTVQVGHSAGYYYTGKNPVLAFDTCVPFGLTSRQQTAWLHEGGGLELLRAAYADFDVVNFPAGNTGAQMGGWFKREITTVADLRGLKMRIPGMGGEVMNRLGVTVQVLAGGDIYPALERGAIDATEWVGPYDDEKLGLQRAARFYYYPGWWEPGPSMSFYVNRRAWDALPKAYQDAFEVAAAWAAQSTQAVYDVKNPEALARLLAGGTQLRRYSAEIMSAARRQTEDLLAQAAARDTGGYGRVYQQWQQFRDASQKWFGTAEQAYSEFVLRQG